MENIRVVAKEFRVIDRMMLGKMQIRPVDCSNFSLSHSRQAKRFICLTLGSGPHALHDDISMTAPQSYGTEAIRVEIWQDATHPKKVPMRCMRTEQNTLSLSLTAMLFIPPQIPALALARNDSCAK
jgi:hypothetical protein